MISEETRFLMSSAVSSLQRTIFNLLCYAERNPNEDDFRTLRNLVLGLPDRIAETYKEELKNLQCMPLDDIRKITFPYSRKPDAKEQTCECGAEHGFPFVVHNGKRLYFPLDATKETAQTRYLDYVENEGILGSGLLTKSPHAYVSDSFKVEPGDIVLDVGCAEALFALDNIDIAHEVYLFECMKKWRKPLEHTFAPYKNKTHIIPKFVSDHTDANAIRLVDALPPNDDVRYFIKMDIEGNERAVLEASREFLKRHKVKMACCVYHRQDDADYISNLLEELGYSVTFSDGYMLPTMNGVHFPYFRKGIVYAKNF